MLSGARGGNRAFSVQPLCSLCLYGGFLWAIVHHRDTENMEAAQRKLKLRLPSTMTAQVILLVFLFKRLWSPLMLKLRQENEDR
jgi:hypothetical protein